MTRIILPSAAGLSLTGFGSGFPGVHNEVAAAGNGFFAIARPIYYVNGVANNTAANSSNQFRWLLGEGTVFNWWDDVVFVVTWFNRLIRLNGNQSSCYPACLGQMAGWLSGSAFDQWITNTTAKRIAVISTRDSGGIINHYLSWCNGVTRSQQNMLAIPSGAFCSLISIPSPREARFYVNGALWSSTTDAALPTGTFSNDELYSNGIAKKLIDATEVSVRLFAGHLSGSLNPP